MRVDGLTVRFGVPLMARLTVTLEVGALSRLTVKVPEEPSGTEIALVEGWMTAGVTTAQADDAVQANIVAAGYGH